MSRPSTQVLLVMVVFFVNITKRSFHNCAGLILSKLSILYCQYFNTFFPQLYWSVADLASKCWKVLAKSLCMSNNSGLLLWNEKTDFQELWIWCFAVSQTVQTFDQIRLFMLKFVFWILYIVFCILHLIFFWSETVQTFGRFDKKAILSTIPVKIISLSSD